MKHYCPMCEKETTTHVDTVMETYQVKGEDIELLNAVQICDTCGEAIWDEERDSSSLLEVYTKYRNKHDLLQPEEIKAIREQFNISQTDFARLLGFGDKTITRYENGSIQDRAHNNMILLMKDVRNFKVLKDNSDGLFSTDRSNEIDRRIAELMEQTWLPSKPFMMASEKRWASHVYSTNIVNLSQNGDRSNVA